MGKYTVQVLDSTKDICEKMDQTVRTPPSVTRTNKARDPRYVTDWSRPQPRRSIHLYDVRRPPPAQDPRGFGIILNFKSTDPSHWQLGHCFDSCCQYVSSLQPPSFPLTQSAVLVFISRKKSNAQGNALLLVGPMDSGKTTVFSRVRWYIVPL